MSKEIGIYISAKDNYSQAIVTMQSANRSFGNDVDELSSKLDELNKTKVTLKIDTDKAAIALREAKKAFSDLGDAANKTALETANADFENARRNLDLVSKNAKQTEKDILSMTNAIEKSDNTMSKSENRAGGIAGASGGVTDGLMSKLAGAGLGKLVGDSLSGALDVGISSAFGSEAGSAISTALSGAFTGVAMGSIAGPVGAAIGGVVGLAAGGIGAATQNFSAKDDSFKSVVQDRYSSIQQDRAASLTGGSAIAANREQKKISFSTLLGGDDAADDYLSQMTDFAADTPFGYDQLANISKTMLAYNYKQDEILPLLTKVGDAGSALSMSGEEMNYVATSLGRMKSSNKTTLEYLNPLIERGIPAMDYLAEASGKSKEEINDMVSKGLIPGAEAARAIADYMGKNFSGNMEKMAESYPGMISTMQDAQDSLDAAMGEGYNKKRKPGLDLQTSYLENPQLKEAYSKMGEWQASLENDREKKIRESVYTAMSSDEYKQAELEENGVKMGELIAKAQSQGINEYNASEGAQAELESQTALISSIRDDASLKVEYWSTGYVLGAELSKGLGSTIKEGLRSSLAVDDYIKYQEQVGDSSLGGLPFVPDMMTSNLPGHAAGLSYVPYDNYVARLHRGEQVLTEQEANSRRSGAASVMVTGNSFMVREDSDIDRIAQAIYEKFAKAQLVS